MTDLDTSPSDAEAADGSGLSRDRDALPPLEQARSVLRRLTFVDGFLLALLGLLPIALVPGFVDVMNPRQAIVMAAIPLSLVVLGRRLRRGDAASWIAMGMVALAAVAAARDGSRVGTLLLGSVSFRELSALALLAAFGFWALGRELSSAGRRALPAVLTAAALVNVAVGLYQMLADPSSGIYATFSGRASGLMSNPVYFASTLIGVWAYWLVRSARSISRGLLALNALLAFGVGISGSRGAIAVGVGLLLVLVALRRTLPSVGAAVAAIGGFGAGLLFLGAVSGSKAERLGNAEQGLGVRMSVWRAAIAAWRDRPFLGWGFDPFQQATNQRFGVDAVREHGRLIWPDPHNLVVLVLVTSGLVGAGLLVAFVVVALRGEIDHALLAAAVAMALSWMLQPVMITAWPIAFVLFGASVRRPSDPCGAADPDPQWFVVSARVAVAVGLVAGLAYVAWSLRLNHAVVEGDAVAADERAGWLIHDPTVADTVADLYLDDIGDVETDASHLSRAEQLARSSIEHGGDPRGWALLVQVQLDQGALADALTTATRWTEQWEADPVAHEYRFLVAELLGDGDTAQAALDRLCDLGSPRCVNAGLDVDG